MGQLTCRASLTCFLRGGLSRFGGILRLFCGSVFLSAVAAATTELATWQSGEAAPSSDEYGLSPNLSGTAGNSRNDSDLARGQFRDPTKKVSPVVLAGKRVHRDTPSKLSSISGSESPDTALLESSEPSVGKGVERLPAASTRRGRRSGGRWKLLTGAAAVLGALIMGAFLWRYGAQQRRSGRGGPAEGGPPEDGSGQVGGRPGQGPGKTADELMAEALTPYSLQYRGVFSPPSGSPSIPSSLQYSSMASGDWESALRRNGGTEYA